MEHTHEGRKEGRINECAITQHFEVMEHEQSAKSWLKKCKFTVKKCLMKFAEKCVLEHQNEQSLSLKCREHRAGFGRISLFHLFA